MAILGIDFSALTLKDALDLACECKRRAVACRGPAIADQ
jgi:hypothetical protein